MRGKLVAAKWDEQNPVGYFSKIKHAIPVLMDKLIEAELDEATWRGGDMVKEIKRAEARTVRIVDEALGEAKPRRKRRELNL